MICLILDISNSSPWRQKVSSTLVPVVTKLKNQTFHIGAKFLTLTYHTVPYFHLVMNLQFLRPCPVRKYQLITRGANRLKHGPHILLRYGVEVILISNKFPWSKKDKI